MQPVKFVIHAVDSLKSHTFIAWPPGYEYDAVDETTTCMLLSLCCL